MNEDAPLTPIQLAPLHMLIKYKRSQRVVDINTKILARLNVSLLEKTIRFNLNHSFKAKIEGYRVTNDHTRESGESFQMSIWICPDPSEWPEPCDLYAKLYCAAICVAASLAAEKEDPEEFCRPHVIQKEWGNSPYSPFLTTVLFGYNIPVPSTGGELLEIIKRRLDLIRDELAGVAESLANGPIPGSTPTDDD